MRLDHLLSKDNYGMELAFDILYSVLNVFEHSYLTMYIENRIEKQTKQMILTEIKNKRRKPRTKSSKYTRCTIYSTLTNSLRLSDEERTVDALALRADEGRNQHRNASGSCK